MSESGGLRGHKGNTRVIQSDRYKLLLDGNEIHLSNLNTDLLTRLNEWHASVTQ